jgi:hypothetical protein
MGASEVHLAHAVNFKEVRKICPGLVIRAMSALISKGPIART